MEKIEGKDFEEIKKINQKLIEKEKEEISLSDIFLLVRNLEELLLDIDKKSYVNIEIAKKIEELDSKIESIKTILEDSLLIGKNAVIYYLRKNKNKPIKLGDLYKKFGEKVVNEVILEFYEKGFIRILK